MSLLTSLLSSIPQSIQIGSVVSINGGGNYSVMINGDEIKVYSAVGSSSIKIGSTVMVSTHNSGRRYIVGVTPTTKSSSQLTVIIDV